MKGPRDEAIKGLQFGVKRNSGSKGMSSRTLFKQCARMCETILPKWVTLVIHSRECNTTTGDEHIRCTPNLWILCVKVEANILKKQCIKY
jgi:hypothetical protein